uniref:Aminopeptidase n=1 Tax=Pithovirus LCPAC401 TaxID=2506595 RepID=A0A481ZAQ0_9VIRU|nr:MAG: aminopeptidase [Pithovirus LCPAC401]
MSEHITTERLKVFSDDFEDKSFNKALQNIISKNNIEDLVINRDQVSVSQNTFSKQIEPRVKVTNQKKSGRCWLFASLNILRREVIKKYNLNSDFELSQTYLFFYDKLEKMNYNLECIMKTSDLDINSRLVNRILSDPASDGGQHSMFINLVRKYGVVPKSVFDETYHSNNSGIMTSLLVRKFREIALEIRSLNKVSDRRRCKEDFNQFAYDMLRKMLGTPPEDFMWEYTDKDDNYHRINVNSPQEFFADHVSFDLDDYICIIHDPRLEHNYYQMYTVEYLNNMSDGQDVKYLNVPIQLMKESVLKSLEGDDAVWFGCDISRDLYDNVMSCNIKQYGELLGTTFRMKKEDRLNTGDSAMNHAMVFCGVNLSEVEGKEVVSRWEVENSWGKSKSDKDDGYYIISDKWFSEYVFEVVINKKYASKAMLLALESKNITTLPLWDPMGNLAM